MREQNILRFIVIWSEKLHKGVLRLLPISTNEQLADFLTKALPPPKFNSFICKLGMINIYHALACGRMLKDNTKLIETHLLNEEEVETSKASITCNTSY